MGKRVNTFDRLKKFRGAKSPAATHIETVLFDFDGTLSNSLELGYEIMKVVCEQHGFTILPQNEYRQLGTREVIKKMGIPLWCLPKLMREGRALMAQKICEATPVAGIESALRNLHSRGITLGIVTSNSDENVARWLKHYGLSEYFDIILGGGRLLRKERCIKKCLKNLRVPKERVIYVGDESRDIAACHKLKIRSVAATWGLDFREKLAKAGPYTIIDHPSELSGIVELEGSSAA
jgi:phosphoglycolate phosphatase